MIDRVSNEDACAFNHAESLLADGHQCIWLSRLTPACTLCRGWFFPGFFSVFPFWSILTGLTGSCYS